MNKTLCYELFVVLRKKGKKIRRKRVVPSETPSSAPAADDSVMGEFLNAFSVPFAPREAVHKRHSWAHFTEIEEHYQDNRLAGQRRGSSASASSDASHSEGLGKSSGCAHVKSAALTVQAKQAAEIAHSKYYW